MLQYNYSNYLKLLTMLRDKSKLYQTVIQHKLETDFLWADINLQLAKFLDDF